MRETQISRREFLRQFVVLGMVSVSGVRCSVPTAQPEYGVEPVPEPAYGVGASPVPQPEVMTYRDRDGVEWPLQGSVTVPVEARFIITFSDAMAESTQDAVWFRDTDGNAVLFEATWSSEGRVLTITPASPLEPATIYLLEVREEARSAAGEPLQRTGCQRAEFFTAGS